MYLDDRGIVPNESRHVVLVETASVQNMLHIYRIAFTVTCFQIVVKLGQFTTAM